MPTVERPGWWGLDRILLGTLKEDQRGLWLSSGPAALSCRDVIHCPCVSSEGKDPGMQVSGRQTWLRPEKDSQRA